MKLRANENWEQLIKRKLEAIKQMKIGTIKGK